jgi:hypothetical protein
VIPRYTLSGLIDQTDPAGERDRSAGRHASFQRLVARRFLALFIIVGAGLVLAVCGKKKKKKLLFHTFKTLVVETPDRDELFVQ